VSRDNPAGLVGKHRVGPAPLLHARRKLRNLSLGVRPVILRVRDQPVDRPALNLIRRPRSLARGRAPASCGNVTPAASVEQGV
jgi:hypothetical protein